MKRFFLCFWIAMSYSLLLVAQGENRPCDQDFTAAIKFDFSRPVEHKFSVSASSSVYFSKGNLLYCPKDSVWRFALNQYDFVGDADKGTIFHLTPASSTGYMKSNNAEINATYSGWIDLYGWGTSGFTKTATDEFDFRSKPFFFDTVRVSRLYNYYSYGPSYNYVGTGDGNIYGDEQRRLYDWGQYNPILEVFIIRNKYGVEIRRDSTVHFLSTWRTLTAEEWNYLMNSRSMSNETSTKLWTPANLTLDDKTYKGTLIFPDDFVFEELGVQHYTLGSSSSTATVDRATWDILEEAGVVFLPYTGYRIEQKIYNVESDGYYWSTSVTSAKQAKAINIKTGAIMNAERAYGYSVRLVKDAE